MTSPRHRRRSVRPQGPPTKPPSPLSVSQQPQEEAVSSKLRFIVPDHYRRGQKHPGHDQHQTTYKIPWDLYEWMVTYTEATGISRNKQVYLAMREFQKKYTD